MLSLFSCAENWFPSEPGESQEIWSQNASGLYHPFFCLFVLLCCGPQRKWKFPPSSLCVQNSREELWLVNQCDYCQHDWALTLPFDKKGRKAEWFTGSHGVQVCNDKGTFWGELVYNFIVGSEGLLGIQSRDF